MCGRRSLSNASAVVGLTEPSPTKSCAIRGQALLQGRARIDRKPGRPKPQAGYPLSRAAQPAADRASEQVRSNGGSQIGGLCAMGSGQPQRSVDERLLQSIPAAMAGPPCPTLSHWGAVHRLSSQGLRSQSGQPEAMNKLHTEGGSAWPCPQNLLCDPTLSASLKTEFDQTANGLGAHGQVGLEATPVVDRIYCRLMPPRTN